MKLYLVKLDKSEPSDGGSYILNSSSTTSSSNFFSIILFVTYYRREISSETVYLYIVLLCSDMRMIRQMCNITLTDRKPTVLILWGAGLEPWWQRLKV